MNELLTEILKISGKKILTLISPTIDFVVDIDEGGNFGYQIGIKELFLAKLHRASSEGGCLIIREFLPIRVQRKVASGKKMWVPEKNLYGIALKSDHWFGLNKEQLKMAYEEDANSGEPLPQEEGVHYQDFACIEL